MSGNIWTDTDPVDREYDEDDPRFRGWHIQYNPKPIPDRRYDYDFWHNDYDYDDLQGGNGLAGNAESEEDALKQIAEIEANKQG